MAPRVQSFGAAHGSNGPGAAVSLGGRIVRHISDEAERPVAEEATEGRSATGEHGDPDEEAIEVVFRCMIRFAQYLLALLFSSSLWPSRFVAPSPSP